MLHITHRYLLHDQKYWYRIKVVLMESLKINMVRRRNDSWVKTELVIVDDSSEETELKE